MTDSKLVAGKPYYEKTKAALKSLERFTVITCWEPPEESVCPSSLAKFFDEINYNVKMCEPNFKSHVVYSVKTPTLDGIIEEGDVIDFVEWLGMVCVDGDFTGSSDNYVNSYEPSEPNVEMGQVRVLVWRGFYQPNQIMKLVEYLK